MSAAGLLPLLSSLQLSDSLFPSGLFTLSHGLETFADHDLIDAGSLFGLVSDLIRDSVGPSDGVALALAHQASTTNDLDLAVHADLQLSAVKLARESRETSLRTGRQLLSLAARVFGGDALVSFQALVSKGDAPGNHAVALGLTMGTLGIDQLESVATELYGFAAGCAGAVLRMSLIDHRQVQELLFQLQPLIAETAAETIEKDIDDIGSWLPFAEIMSMRHESAEIRLFAS